MKKRAAVLLIFAVLIALLAGGCGKISYPISADALKALLYYDDFGMLEGVWEPKEIWDYYDYNGEDPLNKWIGMPVIYGYIEKVDDGKAYVRTVERKETDVIEWDASNSQELVLTLGLV